MSMVTFSENQASQLISYEAGEALVSLQDPQGQGLKWVYSLGSMPTDQIIVVGLGSGFHIAALADFDPQIKITVVDNRDALFRVFESQFPELEGRVKLVSLQRADDIFKTELFEELPQRVPYVVSFMECWGQQSEFFNEVFAHLSGRSLESLQYHFREFGINIKAAFLKSQNLVSLKDLYEVLEKSKMPEEKKQIFRVLNELVK